MDNAIHPNNCLWLVDQNGHIIYYNLESKQFETLSSFDNSDNKQEILFKCVAASKNFLYGVSCDHRLYIYVFSSTNKIFEDYEFYENQRWNLVSGFTNKLLPTDRPRYSNYEGTKSLPKESFILPSNGWQWVQSDWEVVIDSETDRDGWQYSPDFSLASQFTKEKMFHSMVRKRKYRRTAHFSKLDQWIEVDSISDDKYQDPILDVAIGGQDAFNSSNSNHKDKIREKTKYSIWAITISGKIYFRQSVDSSSPEGTNWIEVPFNDVLNNNSSDSNSSDNEQDAQQEIKIEDIVKIAVGSCGLAWCITSCGRCLVRLGVSRENLMGKYWILVEPPLGSELRDISVGQDTVWCVDKKNSIWFRKGIRSFHSAANLMCAIGSSWLKLLETYTYEMSFISVNSFDQVFAISLDKKKLYFRMDVESGQLTGTLWKLIARIQDTDITKENESEVSSLNSNDFVCSSSSSVSYLTNQTTNLFRCLQAQTCLVINDTFFKSNNYLFQKKLISKSESINKDLPSGSIDSNSSMDSSWKNLIVEQLINRFELEMSPFKGKYTKAVENGTWLKSASCLYMFNESKMEHLNNVDLNSSFNNITHNIVNQVNSYLYQSHMGICYDKNDFIRAQLELDRDGQADGTCESGTLTFRFSTNVNEQTKRKASRKTNKATYKTNVINLAEITCVLSSSNIFNFPYPNILFIYLTKNMFIFSFDDEKELNDWFSSLNVALNALNNLNDTVFSPSHKPIILLISLFGQAYAGYLLSDRLFQTKRNKIKNKIDKIQQSQRDLKYKLHKFKENPEQPINEDGETEQSTQEILDELKQEEIHLNKSLEEILIKASQNCQSYQNDSNDKLYFCYLGPGFFKQIEFTATGIVWSISDNGTVFVHNNQLINKNSQQNNHLSFITDTKQFVVFENQRWLPLQGFSDSLLPTDRPSWSDFDGLIEMPKEKIKLPNSEWKWVHNWEVIIDSQTDSDGWQYAIDFSLPYHNQKKISDLVRKRKWSRLAKFESKGQWNQLPDENHVCIKSIAMYEANFNDEDNKKSRVVLWAISDDGECLIRKDVCKENPTGTNWVHVDCRVKLTDVSISGQLIKEKENQDDYFIQVWCVSEDGICYLRHDVTFDNPAGSLFFTIEMTNNNPISKLMSCPSNCFALDNKFNFYFRDKIKLITFPEGLAWIKLKDTKFKILHASFPSNDSNKFWAIIELVDKQKRNLVLVVSKNFNYNLTENYEFRFKPLIKNAFKFVTC